MKNRTTMLAMLGAAVAIGGVAIAGASYAEREWHGGLGHHGHFRGAMGGFAGGMLGGHQLFDSLDTDRDGKLTQSEIDTARTDRFARFDTNGDGVLSLAEFAPLWMEVTRPVMVRAFQLVDADGDSSVTAGEFERPFDRIVARFDRNGDGALSLEDHRQHRDGRMRERDDD
jgi:hypothetical protein